jgi:hypothetical protein
LDLHANGLVSLVICFQLYIIILAQDFGLRSHFLHCEHCTTSFFVTSSLFANLLIITLFSFWIHLFTLLPLVITRILLFIICRHLGFRGCVNIKYVLAAVRNRVTDIIQMISTVYRKTLLTLFFTAPVISWLPMPPSPRLHPAPTVFAHRCLASRSLEI